VEVVLACSPNWGIGMSDVHLHIITRTDLHRDLFNPGLISDSFYELSFFFLNRPILPCGVEGFYL
jgi:hypothetical protein